MKCIFSSIFDVDRFSPHFSSIHQILMETNPQVGVEFDTILSTLCKFYYYSYSLSPEAEFSPKDSLLSRNSYITCEAQCKMKMWASLLKNYWNFKPVTAESRPSESGPCVTPPVTHSWAIVSPPEKFQSPLQCPQSSVRQKASPAAQLPSSSSTAGTNPQPLITHSSSA